MLALALAACLAAVPQDSVVDRPVFTDAAYAVRLPRPDDDWVFVPAAERGTLTVIFHPRNAALSDQLWGALVLTHWGGSVPLDLVADRRVAGTWQPAFGNSFTLLARDSLVLAGYPAIHVIMGGSIGGAVVDVEEYLVARDTDLVVLQLRIPRGEPRDTVAAGYQRVVSGLDLGWRDGATRTGAATPGSEGPEIAIEVGRYVVTLPESLIAVGPGLLTSQAVADGRRVMTWTTDAPGQPASFVTVGRYRRDEVAVGRLRLVVWRLPADDANAARVTPEVAGALARAWAECWAAFGPVPRASLTVVETARPRTAGATGIVLVGHDADAATLTRELARTWWNGYVRAEPSSPAFVADWLPQWSAWMLTDTPPTDTGLVRRTFERSRTVAGDPRLRAALRALAADGRDGASAALFLSHLDEQAATVLRDLLP